MFEFNVDNRSQFWGQDNRREMKGDWLPTHYTYWMDTNNGWQWLIVGNCEDVSINGRSYKLHSYPKGCEIKGMEKLAGPCVARKHVKTYRVD